MAVLVGAAGGSGLTLPLVIVVWLGPVAGLGYVHWESGALGPVRV